MILSVSLKYKNKKLFLFSTHFPVAFQSINIFTFGLMQQYQPEDWLSEVKDFLENTGMQHFVYKLVGYSYKIF